MPPRLHLNWSLRAQEHIARHGVTFDEVEQATHDCLEFRKLGDRYMAVGQTHSGRYITAIVVRAREGGWNVITARPSNYQEHRRVRRRK